MEKPRVRVYTDYKSPYAFVANAALFDLEKCEGVELEWPPYTLRIAECSACRRWSSTASCSGAGIVSRS